MPGFWRITMEIYAKVFKPNYLVASAVVNVIGDARARATKKPTLGLRNQGLVTPVALPARL
jgi:hypothetical protein